MQKYKTRDVLLVSSYFTKLEGYHPVSAGGESTKEKVKDYLQHNDNTDSLVEYQQRAEQAVQWIKKEKDSDWINNIRSCLSKKEVEEKSIGLVASLFSGYDSSLKREADKLELRKSEYQGKPKDNISFQMKSFRHITSGKSKFNDNKDYHIIQLIDHSGNVYIWFADKDYSKDLEICHTVYGLVKSHNERDGVKQTIIDVHELK